MNLERISDSHLIAETERLAREERVLLTCLLHHLREFERRRLYSSLGYKSLFAYAVGRLKYPEDQAQRRISAMRVMRELPEIESKIQSGALSLTNLGMANVVFRRIDAIRDQKLEILQKLENRSTLEAESILAEYCPSVGSRDTIRGKGEGLIELRFTAPEAVKEKIDELKGLRAHVDRNLSLGELFCKLCDLGLDAWRKTAVPRDDARQSKAAIRRKVWARAGHACERCRSKFALEIDHILPKARGGTDEETNLRLLCRACNQRAAIEELGQEKMDEFLN